MTHVSTHAHTQVHTHVFTRVYVSMHIFLQSTDTVHDNCARHETQAELLHALLNAKKVRPNSTYRQHAPRVYRHVQMSTPTSSQVSTASLVLAEAHGCNDATALEHTAVLQAVAAMTPVRACVRAC